MVDQILLILESAAITIGILLVLAYGSFLIIIMLINVGWLVEIKKNDIENKKRN